MLIGTDFVTIRRAGSASPGLPRRRSGSARVMQTGGSYTRRGARGTSSRHWFSAAVASRQEPEALRPQPEAWPWIRAQ
jgi:hypothetical protein